MPLDPSLQSIAELRAINPVIPNSAVKTLSPELLRESILEYCHQKELALQLAKDKKGMTPLHLIAKSGGGKSWEFGGRGGSFKKIPLYLVTGNPEDKTPQDTLRESLIIKKGENDMVLDCKLIERGIKHWKTQDLNDFYNGLLQPQGRPQEMVDDLKSLVEVFQKEIAKRAIRKTKGSDITLEP